MGALCTIHQVISMIKFTLVFNFKTWAKFSFYLRNLVSNKTKGWVSKRVFQEKKARQIFRKNEHFLSSDTHTYVRKIWRALFSWNTRFDPFCPFALLLATCVWTVSGNKFWTVFFIDFTIFSQFFLSIKVRDVFTCYFLFR